MVEQFAFDLPNLQNQILEEMGIDKKKFKNGKIAKNIANFSDEEKAKFIEGANEKLTETANQKFEKMMDFDTSLNVF